MKQRILVVDDEPPTLNLLARVLLDRTAYDVVTESNSLEVPRILENDEFDLIITDLGMPGLDGMEILQTVRAQNRFEEVVIITAFGSVGSALEALSLRVFDYVIKPFRKTQIVGVVERAMEIQRARRADRRLRRVFGHQPYEAAEKAFRREYVRLLAQRAEGDRATMVRQSGLPEESIAELMQPFDGQVRESEE